MSASTASKEAVSPGKSRRPNLRVVPAEAIEKMAQDVMAEATHMRPAITRQSVEHDHLSGRRKALIATRDALADKKALVLSYVETFIAAIDDEIADCNASIGLYSGVAD